MWSRKPAVFFLVRMRVREGGGGKEGKIRLVTNARFSFPVVDFVTHQCNDRNTETMFSTKEIQAAIVEATKALGYSKLRSN